LTRSGNTSKRDGLRHALSGLNQFAHLPLKTPDKASLCGDVTGEKTLAGSRPTILGSPSVRKRDKVFAVLLRYAQPQLVETRNLGAAQVGW